MSKIEWTGRTWNVVIGCRRVSPGCELCYAEGTVHRGMSPQHRGLTVLGSGGKGPRWNGKFNVAEHRLDEPLRRGKPDMWFVNSLSDLFFEPVPFELVAAIFGVMAAAHWHRFQALTKRPERGLQWFETYEGTSGAGATPYAALQYAAERLQKLDSPIGKKVADDPGNWILDEANRFEDWPLANLDLGVTVESQEYTKRVDVLAKIPAALRWVSQEPQIGPITYTDAQLEAIDWLVIGGESDPAGRARPFDLAWARRTIAQCREAGIPVFVKQLGARPFEWRQFEHISLRLRSAKGGDPAEWPEDLRIREHVADTAQVELKLNA